MIKRTITTLALFALVSSALADTKSATTQASMDFLADCTISATDMDMGIYNSRTGATGSSVLRVKCNDVYSVRYFDFTGVLTGSNDTIPYTVSYTKGLLGAVTPMPVIAPPLPGNIVNSTVVVTGSNGLQYDDYFFTGVVAPGLWKPAGAYTDLITFTMSFNLVSR